MLGEKRSKAAFYADSNKSVQEGNTYVEQASGQAFEHGPDQSYSDTLNRKEVVKEVQPENVADMAENGDKQKEKQELEMPQEKFGEYIPPKRPVSVLRTQELFFSADEKEREFSEVLREVQEYLSKEYSSLVTAAGGEEAKAQIHRFAGKYIQDHRITVQGMTTEELIDAIYSEMAEFGFLTKYIYGEGIEEIDVNAWDDVEVQFSGGVTKKLDEHFDSPEHAINVVRRMLHVSGMVLDDASPSVLGHLSKNIRIAVLKTPIVDEDVGMAASIRIVNPQMRGRSDQLRQDHSAWLAFDYNSGQQADLQYREWIQRAGAGAEKGRKGSKLSHSYPHP